MNLILFNTREEATHLEADDPRTRHVRTVLRVQEGGQFFVGILNGPRGRATLRKDTAKELTFDVEWEQAIEPMQPLGVLVGLPRPQTARDLLREAATLGIASLWFFRPEKGEPSYADSRLWQTDEWKTQLCKGAEQAFATRVPNVRHFASLNAAVSALDSSAQRVALDVYEAPTPLSQTFVGKALSPMVFAIGSERGWAASERDLLRKNGFALAHLGARVLRTESALITAFAVWMAARGQY